ncbi:geranylgeranyl diphosphate synthase, type I [Streptomyces sp. WMMB 714]|uniref:polyprenyl synthetase family protein n=1 Tax=Streptomyces sp. WMMB 714 TaxID=1286822 RepID=UPI0008237FA6|nr:polyprenyl synthetase family protein [Streptomyces sp. WMMB 714]SCK51518.1 geranylgeranyl diphosphate synthase, type I [Streptomyces sp. WMMB 714]
MQRRPSAHVHEASHDAPPHALGADPDQDTAAVIGTLLERYLAQRREEAARSSEQFARDVIDVLVDVVLRGGKRTRPAFLWWGWRGCGGESRGANAEAVLKVATALELLQACAVIHDDLMDGSPSRRGAPAAHVAFADRHRAAGLRGDPDDFGAYAAVLAGDLALVWAHDLFESAGLDAKARRAAAPAWQAMRTEIIAGQYLDLYGQSTGVDSPEESLRVAYLKSGLYTVERPLHLGAAIAGAGPDLIASLRRAGRSAGVAFQLRNDLVGVFGSDGSGEPSGDDIKDGASTYLTAIALQRARAHSRHEAERQLRDAIGNRDLSPEDLRRVRDLLTRLGAADAVEARIEQLTADALTVLEQARLRAPAHERLPALVRRVVEKRPAG